MEYEDPTWFGDLRVPDITDPVELNKRNREARLECREYTDRAKDVPCADCGVQYPPYVMDFDHVRGTKLSDVSQMVRVKIDLRRVQAEIDKCDVVCANCHRERTHQRRRLDKTPQSVV